MERDADAQERASAATASRSEHALLGALALICGFMMAEVAVGLIAHSLALFADAGHMVTDAGALAGAIWAARLAARPAGGVWTYGLKRAEILAAAANGATLLVVAALITFEAIVRLLHPPAVAGSAVLGVALAGVVVNMAATALLRRANLRSLNVKGAFRHVVTDLAAFVATAIAGVILLTTGFRRADAIASLVVVTLMLKTAAGLLHESGRILLEAAPANPTLGEVRSHLLEIPHVRGVHDLHIWTLTSELPALSAHVVVEDCCFVENHAPQVLDDLQACLAGHFDVEHSTFQLELLAHLEHESGGHA